MIPVWVVLFLGGRTSTGRPVVTDARWWWGAGTGPAFDPPQWVQPGPRQDGVTGRGSTSPVILINGDSVRNRTVSDPGPNDALLVIYIHVKFQSRAFLFSYSPILLFSDVVTFPPSSGTHTHHTKLSFLSRARTRASTYSLSPSLSLLSPFWSGRPSDDRPIGRRPVGVGAGSERVGEKV